MDYEHFITTVQHEAGVSKDEAERAVGATLTTLAERISGGEANDIAKQLPSELRRLLGIWRVEGVARLGGAPSKTNLMFMLQAVLRATTLGRAIATNSSAYARTLGFARTAPGMNRALRRANLREETIHLVPQALRLL